MGKAYLTALEVSQLKEVVRQYPDEPEVFWAALAEMGDDYAKAAYRGLTNPNSVAGHAIANSNMVSGVSAEEIKKYKLEVMEGYLNLLERKSSLSPNGDVRLPTTTDIETNYYNAATKIGVSPYSAVSLCVAKLASPDGENWYKNLYGTGANLNPLRWGPPSPVLANLSTESAALHFGTTSVFAGLGMTFDELFGAKGLNAGEDAWLKANSARQQYPVAPGIIVNESRAVEFLRERAPQVNGLPWQRGLAPGEEPRPQDALQFSPGTAEGALDPHQRYQSPAEQEAGE